MKVLLTGFGPFADVVDNPSGRIALHFESSGIPGHELIARVLPVSFRRADEEIRRLLRETEPDVALLIGVAGKADRFRLELAAANEDRARVPDCDGESPQDQPIVDNGPESLQTHFDVHALATRLVAEGYPVHVSTSAGRYVCNRTYYAALNEIATAELSTRCLFLHVPPDKITFGLKDDGHVPFEAHVQVVERLLDEVLVV